ncbi:hypothetical protein [Flavobacterium sp. N2038]|uniref:hypothetical protein n=1 Tax=Flavobacterium sp. N2038 TaxID=2986829 RepID=UPI0022244CBE|nr:hypothetical protein [Flavobacterium sp. N2038]
MNKLTILLLLIFSNNLFSQEITEEQRTFYTKVLHGADSLKFNKTTRNAFKFVEYKEGDFFKQIITPEEISSCTKLAKETAKLSLNDENQLILSGALTTRFNGEVTGILSIKLLENNLIKENGEKFQLNTLYNSNNGYGKINLKTNIKSNYTKDEKITGFVKFEINYLIGYDKVELTLNDIGKNITLNDCNYTIINIKENEIVLNKLSEKENELNVINFDKTGKVAKSYSYSELLEMTTKDSTISMESFDRKNRETYKMVRDLFEKKPKISLAEFKDFFTIDKLIEMKKEGKYVIVESIAPFQNKLELYSPKFHSEVIKVDIKQL